MTVVVVPPLLNVATVTFVLPHDEESELNPVTLVSLVLGVELSYDISRRNF